MPGVPQQEGLQGASSPAIAGQLANEGDKALLRQLTGVYPYDNVLNPSPSSRRVTSKATSMPSPVIVAPKIAGSRTFIG